MNSSESPPETCRRVHHALSSSLRRVFPAALCAPARHTPCSYETSPDDSSITAYFKPSAGVNSVDNNSSSRLRAGDGSSYSKSASDDDGRVAVQAKLLVASDGYFSRVRRQCLDDGLPQVSSEQGRLYERQMAQMTDMTSCLHARPPVTISCGVGKCKCSRLSLAILSLVGSKSSIACVCVCACCV